MTVTSTTLRNTYTGNNSATVFAYQFRILDETEILVTVDGVTQVLNGGGSDGYTVSGVGNLSGGDITFNTAPASSTSIVLLSNPDFTQEIDYNELDAFPAESHEEGLDRGVIRDLSLKEEIDRAILSPVTTTLTSNVISGTIDATQRALVISTAGVSSSDLANFASDLDVILTSVATGDLLEYDGSNWVNVTTLQGDLTFSGTNTFSASVDFDGGYTVAGSQTVDVGANRIQNVATPTASTDAATKAYVDSFVYPNFISGLAWALDAGDTDHDIEFSAGAAADDTNSDIMVSSGTITKKADAVWAEGDDEGGLDTGTIAVDTWYHFFEIKNPTSGTVDFLISTSLASPVMPTGYTLKRRVGALKTDGSGNFIPVTTYGSGTNRTIQLNTPVQEVNTTSSTTAANITLSSVPTGVKVNAMFTGVGDFAGGAVIFYDPDTGAKTPNQATGLGHIMSANNDGNGYFECFTNTSAQVAWDSNVAGRNIDVSCLGWEEFL